MATGKPVFYWDTAPLIAWIKDEKRADPSEMDGIAEVINLVENGKGRTLMSVLWRAEVLSATLTPSQKRKLKEIFEYRIIEEQGIDSRVMDLASEIRAFHKKDTRKSTLKNIRTPDAIHLATAIHYSVTEFHTFDGARENGGTGGLLTLNGNVANNKLKICVPHATQLLLQLRSDEAEEEGEE